MKATKQDVLLDSTSNVTHSEGFSLQKTTVFVGIWVPTIDTGTITLKASPDSGTTKGEVVDPSDGSTKTIVGSGTGNKYVDVSDWVRAWTGDVQFFIVTGGNQTANRTFTVYERG